MNEEDFYEFVRKDGELSKITNLNAVQRSMTLLHVACYLNAVQFVEKLLKTGSVDLDFAFIDGFTAVHWAAMLGHYDCLVLLMKAGAKVDKFSASKWTPLARAFDRIPHQKTGKEGGKEGFDFTGQQACIRLLLSCGASLSKAGRCGRLNIEFEGTRELKVSFL